MQGGRWGYLREQRRASLRVRLEGKGTAART